MTEQSAQLNQTEDDSLTVQNLYMITVKVPDQEITLISPAQLTEAEATLKRLEGHQVELIPQEEIDRIIGE